MEPGLSFGRWLKHRRLDLKLTQAELARLVSYSTVTIRKIESEELRPSRQLAEKLAEQLDLHPADRLAFIRFARGEDSGETFRPLAETRQAGRTPGNLPAPPTLLIGRRRETEAGRRLLSRRGVRLVTLTGPGGSGKTRLALQIAAETAEQFSDGVFFVDLAPIVDPALIIPAIAAVLDVPETPGRILLDSLKYYLRAKQLLLLLDNFEQLLSGATSLAQLLAAAPHLKILVTSRVCLRLRGEHEFPVLPLAVPDLGDRRDAPTAPLVEWVAQYPAVELLVHCACAVRPEFRLSPDNARAVAEICARLDGLPLAIELAAVRLRVLSPTELLDHLGARLRLLAEGPPDAPARQQSLRDTLAWSYNLLAGREQALFSSMSVFAGGCTLDAVAAVAGVQGAGNDGQEAVPHIVVGEWAPRLQRTSPTPQPAALPAGTGQSGAPPLDLLDAVTSLIAQNLLWQRETAKGTTRFGMLETIREFALEQLRAGGSASPAQERHAGYFLGLAEQSESGLRGPQQLEWLERLELEHDNFRAALRWAIESGARETALRLVGALRWFWTQRTHLTEGLQWATAALDAFASPAGDPLQAKALYSAGVVATFQGDSRALTFLQESATIWRELGDMRGLACALQHLGLAAFAVGDLEFAHRAGSESIDLFRAVGDRSGLGLALVSRALALTSTGEHEGATSLLDQCSRIFREAGDSWGLALVLRQLARLRLAQGENSAARSLLEESIALWRQFGTRHELAPTLANLGESALRLGDSETARACLVESMVLSQPLALFDNIVYLLEEFAALAVGEGHAEQAALLQHAAGALQATLSRAHIEGGNDAGFDLALSLPGGRVMSLDQVCDYALGQARPGY